MVDPISAGLMIGGKVIQGVGAYKAGKANSKALMAERRDTMRQGAERELQTRHAARKAMGDQIAAQFSNGMMGGTGSALDALRESQIEAALDVMAIRQETAGRSAQLKSQAKSERTKGKFALAGSIIGAASDAFGMASDWGAANSGSSGGKG